MTCIYGLYLVLSCRHSVARMFVVVMNFVTKFTCCHLMLIAFFYCQLL